ncbi:MAG TPA: hypothetical protein VK666_08040 [Chryseolinea sp.]|nr:hypothetical protein [Chryseolinea sp.]
MKYFLPLIALTYCTLSVNLSEAQTAAVDNKLSKTITFHPIPKGPAVFGIFEGRAPCPVIARQLKLATTPDCEKLKCDLIFYRDPATSRPTTYTLSIVGGGDVVKMEGSSYRYKVLEGKWKIIQGTKSNPDAVIFQLALDGPGDYLYILKGDENVLFILDEDKGFRAGNEDFSYTLNRVELVPGKK